MVPATENRPVGRSTEIVAYAGGLSARAVPHRTGVPRLPTGVWFLVTRLVALVLLVLLASAHPARADQEEAGRLLERLEERYASLEGLQADFIQIWRPGRFGGAVEEKGTLWVRAPGMARWEYLHPERKVAVVTRGGVTWFYQPEERQAVRGELDDPLPPHLALLFGRKGLSEGFRIRASRIAPPTGEDAGLAVLTLESRNQDPAAEGRRVVLTLETDPVRIQSVVVQGAGGEQTEYLFLNQREETVPPLSLFRFEPPEGVEVLRAVRDDAPQGGGSPDSP